MNINHDNLSSSVPASEATATVTTWQLAKAGFGLGAGWAAGEAAVGLVTGGVAAIGAGAAGLGAAALAGAFGGKEEKKEEPKR